MQPHRIYYPTGLYVLHILLIENFQSKLFDIAKLINLCFQELWAGK